MTHFLRSAFALGALAVAASAQTASFFPLKTGNTWTYRETGGSQTLTIRVGLPLSTLDGRIYYSVHGYGTETLFVRRHESGNLYWYNSELNREEILTSFEAVPGAHFHAPWRPCESDGQVQTHRPDYNRLGDGDGTALAITYRNYNCADTGIESEQYVENIGMVKRTVNTFAGPVQYELVSARLGNVVVAPDSTGRFQAEVHHDKAQSKLNVTLRVSLHGDERALDLMFPTSQDYDIAIRDSEGNSVYQWSAGRAFLQTVRVVSIFGERRYDAEVPLNSREGASLPEGRYTLEAWLVCGESGRQFATSVPFTIASSDPKEVQ